LVASLLTGGQQPKVLNLPFSGFFNSTLSQRREETKTFGFSTGGGREAREASPFYFKRGFFYFSMKRPVLQVSYVFLQRTL
jgi:hypothetical protein